MDNPKIQKLLSLYNDKSITIEEKRTIAVKLIDIGYIKPNNLVFDNKYLKLRKDYAELELEYLKYVRRCDMYVRDFNQQFKQKWELEDKLSKSVIENHKLQSSIANYRLGIGILLVITIISLFI
jgi:hypothetical protein